jgi:hypothetical protein
MLAAMVACATSACAAVSTLETPRALPPGRMQYAVAPELNGGGMRQGAAKIAIPELSGGVRRGLGHGVELSGKLMLLPLGDTLTSVGGELAVKVELHRDDRLSIAALGGAGYRHLASSGAQWEAIYANAPILIGVGVRGDRDQIVFGPRVGWQRWYSSGARPVDVPQIGSSLAYAWGVRPSLTVMPELSLLYSPTPVEGRATGSVLFSFALGFLFGH